MMREAVFPAASLLLAALTCACGDEGSKSKPQQDAGGDPMGQADASVPYAGPTRGGAIPEGAELAPEKGDEGPFEVSDACCNVTLSVAKEADELSARVVGDLPSLEGAGQEAEVVSDTFSADLCMPVNEAIKFRFEVEAGSDGGTTTLYRTDPAQPTVEDENGELWNLSVFTCGDAGS